MSEVTEVTEVIYGRNPVRAALQAGRSLNRIYIADGVARQDVADILDLARKRGVVFQFTERRRLDRLTDGRHQGVVATVAGHQYAEMADILASAGRSESPPFLVLLDGIQDPHNLGAIIRTADAVRADGVVIPRRNAAGLTAAAVKASAGASVHVPVARVANMNHAMQALREAGVWLVGLAADGPSLFSKMDYTVPVALVIGGEGKGLRPLVRRNCDEVVRLPVAGHVDSLNASVAAALVLYEVFRQRQETAGR
ncbi:MAG: 23S rRNA (guanosine(2251)-2'-O)-methyltransferase RlmB [Gemmatimonadetes bacterium]|nr:23S rRNA (guanosine(2251)-2'-O)-methyltransferase RlmB [Gemmatimonadota bacterium]